MEVRTKDEIKYQRRKLFGFADSKRLVKKGNRQVKKARVCAVCGRPLTTYISLRNHYITSQPHYYLKTQLLDYSLCADISMCTDWLDEHNLLERSIT